MKIVLVAREFPPRVGGASTYWYEIFRGLSNQNIDVDVITLTHRFFSSFNHSKVHRIRTNLPYSPIFLVDFLPKVRNQVISLHPDLIYSGTVEAFALSRSQQPLVLSVHDTTLGTMKMYQNVPISSLNFKDIAYRLLFSRFFLQLEKRAFQKCNSIICISKALRKEVTNYYRTRNKQIHVLPLGVDLERFSPSRNDPSLRNKLGIHGAFLLYIGRLDYQKGVDDLVYSMRYLRGKIDATLVIVGEGPRIPILKELVHDLKLENNVFFAGFVPSKLVPNFYASADVVVSPHRYVGFSSSILESLASGVPVVATGIGGNSELINEKYGSLVPPRSPNKIAEAVIDILDTDIKKMKIHARIEAEKYDWKKIINSLLTIFKNLISTY